MRFSNKQRTLGGALTEKETDKFLELKRKELEDEKNN